MPKYNGAQNDRGRKGRRSGQNAPQPARNPRRRAGWFIPLLIVVLGVAAYHNSLGNEFVFDDQAYIEDNPYIRSLRPLGPVLLSSTRPVVNLSFAINYALGGLDPWGYRLTNVVIHLLAGLLLYGIVRRSMESPHVGGKWAAAGPWLAGLIAALWVVHPLQTESVSYVWQRCESLVGLFYLLTLYCVIRNSASDRKWLWAPAAVISCALGMATKEVMVTAPVVILIYDRVFLAGSWKEVMRLRWKLHAGLAGTWLILLALLARGAGKSGIYLPTADVAYEGIRPWNYLLTQAGVIVHYLRIAFWPRGLCLDYATAWPVAQSIADVWPQLAVVVGLLALTCWGLWKRPALGFVGLALFLILSPTSSFVPITDVVFEHRMYLPLAAVLVLTVLLVAWFLERLPSQWRGLRWVAGATGLAILIALTVATVRRNEDYRTSLSIWNDTANKAPRNARAHNNLGLALHKLGRNEEAIARFEQAMQLRPNYPEAHNNWGLALAAQGDLPAAITHYDAALHVRPQFAAAHNNWGNALKELGRFDDAAGHFQAALKIQPDYAQAYNNLGTVLHAVNRFEDAIAQYEVGVRYNPNYAELHYNWGLALRALKRPQEAMAQYQAALRIKPNFPEAHNDWGTALAVQGQLPAAIEHFREALRLNKDFAPARHNLQRAEAMLQKQQGR